MLGARLRARRLRRRSTRPEVRSGRCAASNAIYPTVDHTIANGVVTQIRTDPTTLVEPGSSGPIGRPSAA